MKHRRVAQFLAAWMIVALLWPAGVTGTVFAQETIWVEVDTASEFNEIRNNLTASYRLMADIDLSGYSNWLPIGLDASRFTGQLDGNGKVIRNLSLANTSTAYQGLFGVIGASGKLTNVVVENANVSAGNTAGILAGANYGQISASSAKGNLSGQDNVGGLVGSNAGQITNAFAQVQVTGQNNVGGLAGSNSGSVQNSYAASAVSTSVLNNYLLFDGVDDFIEIPHQAYYLTNSFTIEAWFEWDDVGTDNVHFITGKGFEQFEIHTGGGSGVNGIRFIPVYRPETLYNDGRAYQDVYNVIQPGWFHVAAVWDYSTQTARVYINGQPQDIYQAGDNVGLIAPVPLASPATNPYADNFEDFTIGIRSDGFFPFKGKISDVRFWNTVRSSEQIYADKNKQLTGSEAGLIGYWKLDETSGVIAEDSTSNNNDGTVFGNAIRVQETGSNFGGLVGLNSGTVTSSYYDSTISGQTDTGKGDPQPTSAMQTAGTFSGWDFATLWKINEGSSYPYFNRYTLSYSAGANGSLTGSASQTVSPGGTGSAVTAAPNTNYKFDKWSDNLTTATRQDANVTTSLSVSASFLEAVPPTTQSIVVADTSLIVGEASVVTFTFSEAVSGLTTADLTVGSGSLSEPSSSNGGSTWTATLTPAANTSNATNIITLNNSGVQDLAGNAGSGSTNSNNYAVDTIRPTASIVVYDTSLLAGEASPVIFIFSEAVSGLTTTDLTVGSGSLSEPVTSDGGITWAATLIPAADTSDAANVVTLNNSGVADMAGNVGSGTTNSNTYTVNTVRPTTESIVVSDTSLIVGETSAVTFTFSEAVSGLTTTDLTVGSGSLSEPATSDGGVTWTATLTPATNTSDAANIITLNNSGVQNAVGNAGSGSTASNNYAVDTIRPTASIVVSDTSLAAGETSAVTFTFSEAVSGLSTADLTVGSGSLSEPSSSDGGITWTATLTPAADTSNATNVITLDTSGVTDMAGNAGSGTTISNTYAVNTVSPSVTVEQAVGQSDPVNTSPILFTATFSEAVTGFSAEDVSFAGSTATGTLAASISGSGPAYTVSVSGMTGPGTVVVSIPADKASNSAGNSNTASTSSDNAVTYDAAAPTLTVEKDSAQADPTSASPILFTATFSEAVTGFSAEDVSFEGSTAPGTLAASISGSGLAYTVSVSGMTGSGSVVVSILANAAADAAGNLSAASTSTDNTVVYDVSAPTVTVEQASDQSDPANTGPIRFIATFSKPVSGLTAEDVSFTGSTAPGTLTAEVSAYSPSGDPLPGGDPDPGTELAYTISVSGMTGSGLVMVSLPANAAADALGNQSDASTSSDNTVTYDVSAPTVTVEQASDQADPVNTGPIRFTAVFSENVTGFNAEDVSFVGSTAPGTLTATVSSSMIDEDPAGSAAPGADKGISIGYRYTISVSGMSGNGTVVVSIPANRVLDASSNPNAASTSTDNSVTFDTSTPEVSIPGIQVEYTGSGPASFGVNFDKPVFNPEGHSDPDDVTNPANYLLVKNGPNQLFDTLSCAEGLAPDDIQFAVSSVDYDSENNTSTIRLASRLPVGTYRLFVCGTTSIVDLAGNPINGGEDAVFDFSVRPEPESLPETGFAPGKFTTLPAQPANLAYASSGLTLSIPGLGVQTAIVGVPRSEQSWDVSWLGSRAGYLYGSAYPTWQGNTVLTGHVWDADNTPGIFANLKSLRYGDPLQILTGGQTYTYEVRENSLISARGVTQVFEPKEQDWLTLVTCESFDAEEDVYRLRRVVRAVLVSVE